ncbi:MAG TPA: aminotransferase class V-fold PLP-dependent enzyme, partial [Planctomycetota bacterium]|nr:aminotransferase class V-fold PLP-dependent enzyme [Planctomycetota bacterium]
GIAGLGKACAILSEEMDKDIEHCRRLRDRLEAKLSAALDHVSVNGSREHRLPNLLNMSFAYVEGESLLMGIKDVAVSSGSACTSASLEPSYVLRALGLPDELAHSSIRFSLGRFNNEAEVDYVADIVTRAVRRLREMSPLYEMVQEGVDLSKVQWQSH